MTQMNLLNFPARDPRTHNLLKLRPWMPRMQYEVLRESDEHDQIVEEMVQRIESMPTSGATDGQGGRAMVVLHYFIAGSDWYVTEKDSLGNGTAQAFGWVVLNGDLEYAELGYLSVYELVSLGIELDLHWQPRPLAAVMRERGARPLPARPLH